MLDYKDILNKYYVIKLSAREISRQTGMSKSGVLKFIHVCFVNKNSSKEWQSA